jgi:hypothetical protein
LAHVILLLTVVAGAVFLLLTVVAKHCLPSADKLTDCQTLTFRKRPPEAS